jgi:F-type H+-transporting ATPase subunit b
LIVFLATSVALLGLAPAANLYAAGAPGRAAAESDHAAGGHGNAAHGEGEDTALVDPKILDLALWTVVVFLVLMFVLSKFAWKPMLAGLQKREENIRSALAAAEAAREEAKQIQASLQKQLANAHDQVRQILDEGRKDAEQLRETELARTQSEIRAERERLHREIEMQTAQAVQHIWSQAADLATLASAKALGKGITEDGHRRLIDEALAEIKQTVGRANGHA